MCSGSKLRTGGEVCPTGTVYTGTHRYCCVVYGETRCENVGGDCYEEAPPGQMSRATLPAKK